MAFRRVLVVDDSPIARKVVSEIVLSIEGISDVVTASNGRLALDRLSQDRFDLVILDVEMPEMDGIATLRVLRSRHPALPVLMFSALTERAGTLTLEALALGARDYLTKPTTLGPVKASIDQLREQLTQKVRGILPTTKASRVTSAGSSNLVEERGGIVTRRSPSLPAEILAFGASTGGPVALTEILMKMPADLSVPIVIVQHMPSFFTRLFAKRLDDLCAIRVEEATSGDELLPGRAWVAPGDWHMQVRRQGGRTFLATHQDQPENSCRPSVDVLFRSVAEAFGPAAVGIVLTGMGEDGLRGSRAIREKGGRVISQDEPSSVVWGMPGAVARAGLSDRIASLEELPDVILETLRRGAVHAPEASASAEVRR